MKRSGPAYLRLTRQKLDDVNGDGYRFEFGKAVTLRDGSDVLLIGTGATVQEALREADELSTAGTSARVMNVHTLKPLDAEGIVAAAQASANKVVTVEDHNVVGGLGSAVAEALSEAGSGARLKVLGCQDYGQSGTSEELYDAYGIAPEPERIAYSVQELGLKHVVITMVARDDLPDGSGNRHGHRHR